MGNNSIAFSPQVKIFLVSLTIHILLIITNGGLVIHPDSYEYRTIIEYLGDGREITDLPFSESVILFRPLMFYLCLPLYFITNDAFLSIGIVNSIFYFCTGQIFYKFVREKLDEDIAFWSAIYFVSCFPVLYWGLSLLIEMGTWFFLIASLYFTCNLSLDKITNKDYFGLILKGFSILFKPSLFVLPLFFFMQNFFKYRINNFPIKNLFFAGFLISIPLMINQVVIWSLFSADYFNDFFRDILFFWEKDTVSVSSVESQEEYAFKYTQTYRILTFLIAFPLLLPFLLIGFRNCKKNYEEFYNFSKMYCASSLIIILGFSSTLEYVGAGSPRYAFLLFPVVIPIIVLGIKSFFKDYIVRYANYWIINYYYLIILYAILSIIAVLADNEIRNFIGLWIREA